MAKQIIEQLQPIFAPRSIAIIGASNTAHKWGGGTLERLLETGYKGAVYPINPREAQIKGLPVYRSVLDVADEIDLAVIIVRAELVPQAMKECVQKGIKGAVIISAGFAETGNHGRALQEQITDIAQRGNIRLVGPNCMGIWNASTSLNLALYNKPASGCVSFISQSGTFGGVFAHFASNRGYGLGKFISIGNQADLDVADYLEYLADDPDTKAIVIYLEGFPDGRKLFRVAREMAGKKPVVVYKAGKNQAIARITMSHTANIAGEDKIFDAFCQQIGFIRANELLNALDMAAILTRQPLPKGNRIGILGTGGQCVVLADTCISLGMEIPELREEDTRFIISDIEFPPHAPIPRNPVDFATGSHTALTEAKVLNKLAQLDYIDGVITNTPAVFHRAARTSAAEQEKIESEAGELFAAIPQKYGKPVVTLGFGGPPGATTTGILKKFLDEAGISSYPTPEEAAKAMSALVQHAQIKRRFAD